LQKEIRDKKNKNHKLYFHYFFNQQKRINKCEQFQECLNLYTKKELQKPLLRKEFNFLPTTTNKTPTNTQSTTKSLTNYSKTSLNQTHTH